MGVDYDACGGVGFRVSKEQILNATKKADMYCDDLSDDYPTMLDRIFRQYRKDLCYISYGSCYSGEIDYAVIIKSKNNTLGAVLEVKDKFVENFNSIFGTSYVDTDLEIIQELFIH